MRLEACGASRFEMIGLNLEEQIHAELVIVRKSSSEYLTEAAMGNRFHALHRVRSLIRRSRQEHLDSCAQLSMTSVRVGYHRYAAWYSQTELLQTGWLTRWI